MKEKRGLRELLKEVEDNLEKEKVQKERPCSFASCGSDI